MFHPCLARRARLRAALFALLAPLVLLVAATAAHAQTPDASNTLPRGIFEPSGRNQTQTQPTALVTRDSVSGAWCIVGATETCVLPGTGGGGGGGGDATEATLQEVAG
ncbi:MAG: hypothetical protein KIS90_10115, partial [Phenylobacterium sp.]|nr:hypothetical protein [Phenylobacterium sp.]